MKSLSIMLIAGEASGDLLAAELAVALREAAIGAASKPTRDAQPLDTPLAPRFFGAGGPRMAAAGVDLAFDLTQHSVIGLSDVLKKIATFRNLLRQLLNLAIEQQPDFVIGVDYGGFNLHLARAIREHVRRHRTEFVPWNPKIVQFISPQVWASRPARADAMARDHDLVLSIFPFEKAWYARRVPKLRVEFVGHPMVERIQNSEFRIQKQENGSVPRILLLPGSRTAELRRHLPPMLGAWKRIRSELPSATATMVLPNENLAALARELGVSPEITLQIGNLPKALAQSDVAIASTGTVTMECAFFGVPTVTLYKTSWSTYQVAKRIVTVKSLTMPNLLAGEPVFPEFVQGDATAANLAGAALELLKNKNRRDEVRRKLEKIIATLGGPGATRRAAEAILSLS
ncbi:MAG: lipid-A-disaccharide synthase [Verrucomicrobiota bacterium]